MYYTVSELSFDSKITALFPYKEFIALIDESFKIHLLDCNRHYSLGGALSLPEAFEGDFESMHFDRTTLQFSSKNHLALTSLLKNQNIIFSLDGMLEQTHTISWHKAHITACAYSSDGRLFATADCKGYIYLFETGNYSIVCAPTPTEDDINTIAFSQYNDFILYSTLSGEVYVYNLFSKQLHCKFSMPSSIRKILHTDNYELSHLLSTDGKIYTYDMGKKILTTLFEEEMYNHLACYDPKLQKIILANKSGNFSALSTQPDTESIFLNTDMEGISHMHVLEHFLILGFNDKRTRVIDLDKFQFEINVNFDVKNFSKIRDQFSRNHFLYFSDEIQTKTEAGWYESLQGSIQALIEDNTIRAHKLAAPFFEDKRKEEQYKLLNHHIPELKQFHTMIKNKDVEGAYRMISSYPFLKLSKKYEDLERHWNSAYNASKKLMIKDPELNCSICTRLLNPYKWDEEKYILIENLINNPEILKRLENAIKHQNFKLYFSLCEKHPFLEQTLLHQKLLIHARKKIKTIRKLITSNQLDKAQEEIAALEGYLPFEEEREHLQQKIAFRRKFQDARTQLDQARMFDLLLQDYRLVHESLFANQLERYENTLKLAMSHAHKGEVKSTLKHLEPYMEISALAHAMASVLKVAYVNQLIYCKVKKLSINWESSLENYLIRFGYESILRRFILHFKMLEMLEPLLEHANSQGHLEMHYLESIIVKKQTERME